LALRFKMGMNHINNFRITTVRRPTKSSKKDVIRGLERMKVTGAAPNQIVKTWLVLTALPQTRFRDTGGYV